MLINLFNISEKGKNDDKIKENSEVNFWNFILFRISCEKRKSFFNVYQKFRIKIISEEHLIRNHLNIYNLMRVTERKRNTRRRNSYQLNDLIKLV